jgi:hypothetical protein
MKKKQIAVAFIISLIIFGSNGCIRRTNREALHTYLTLNIALQEQKENIDMKNAELLSNFNNDTIQYPRDKAINVAERTQMLCDFITEMKLELVMHTDDVDEVKAKERIQHPFLLKRKGDYDRPTHYFGTNNPPGELGKAHDLKIKLAEHQQYLLQLVEQRDKEMMKKRLDLLDPKVPEENNSTTWEMFYFYHAPLAGALAELTRLQVIVCQAETDMLTYLSVEIEKGSSKVE